MLGIKQIKGEFEEKPDLLIAAEIRASFPSPADDYLHESKSHCQCYQA